jgi:peptidoglycan-associated lipoprotein
MRQRMTVTASVLLFGVAVAGCAKQPATMAASAPAPSGAAMTSPAKPMASAASTSGRTGSSSTGSTTRMADASGRPATQEFRPLADLLDVHFDFDRYDIRPDAARTLAANARLLRARGESAVLVEGHCDERGTSEYNLALGERRARAAMNALVSQGVDARRITIVSYGEDRPACRDHSEACWAQNRRARFLVRDR